MKSCPTETLTIDPMITIGRLGGMIGPIVDADAMTADAKSGG